MMTLSEIMTEHPFTLGPENSVKQAMDLMQQERIRHIPIVDDAGQLVGLVSQRDLLSLEHKKDPVTPLREVMRTDLTTVTPDTPLRAAAETMIYNKFGCLPVVADGELVGIITETDFLKLAIFPIAPKRGQ